MLVDAQPDQSSMSLTIPDDAVALVFDKEGFGLYIPAGEEGTGHEAMEPHALAAAAMYRYINAHPEIVDLAIMELKADVRRAKHGNKVAH